MTGGEVITVITSVEAIALSFSTNSTGFSGVIWIDKPPQPVAVFRKILT